MLEVFEKLRPRALHRPLIRIGDDADGAYLIPDDLDGITACFSPGVNNFKTFEDAMVERYGMNCHMCDFTSEVEKFRTPLIEGKQTFIKKWLDRSGADAIRLEDWVAEYEPEGDLLLQIDIEGAEYRNLLAVPDELLARFRIIVMELHGLRQMTRQAFLEGAIAPFFDKISRLFITAHVHPNNGSSVFRIPGTYIDVPNTIEATFIRRDRISGTLYPPQLPHPLDIGVNDRGSPPLFLGEGWVDGPRSQGSLARMGEIEAAYEARQNAARSRAEADNKSMMRRARATTGGPVPEELREVAAGRPFELSSIKPNVHMSRSIQRMDPYFFHTREAHSQYIRIDLEESVTVGRISITNRTDSHFGKARSLFAIVSETLSPNHGGVVAIEDDASFQNGQRSTLEIEVPGLRGRYVFIRSSELTALHLSDIKVFAAP